jgi:putative DNA primase/helicase
LCRGRWETITENKSVLSNRNSIVRLADYGLAVTSNNAGVIIQYLTDFESANNTIIPTSDVVSKIGWRDFDFLPFTSNSIFFEADDSAGSDLAAGLTEHGSFKQWLTAAETVRKASAASRFLFSASFASPLMKLIDARTFMVFVWCESGYGKSGSKCPKRLVGN